MTNYKVYDISEVEQIDFEQMGTKSKFWYKDELGDLYLFKATLSTDKYGNDIQRFGEDWAEKIACEISKLLNIPCANYELATFRGQAGVITKNIVATNENMLTGNTLLTHLDNILSKQKLVPIPKMEESKLTNENHIISRISVCLSNFVINKPIGWNSLDNIKNAEDVFIGYLMLDALISNQDRHNQNWGMIYSPDNRTYLAPTFDHAASLGRNESDENRKKRLKTKDKGQSISTYVNRAKSQIYNKNGQKLKTIDAFYIYGFAFATEASLSWIKILKSIEIESIKEIVNRVPDSIMSKLSKEFSIQIILENRKRLISLEESLFKELNNKNEEL